MVDKFDVAVIGSGPAGYTAAIRCARKGATVCIIEKNSIGGVCLNCGCIPSKTLLASAHTLLVIKNASNMGIEIENLKVDWLKIQQRKDSVIAGLKKGLIGLIENNKIKILQGTASMVTHNTIHIDGNTSTDIEAEKIIIATGSTPIEIPFMPFDGDRIISSTEALNLQEIPASMVIVGGGVIGCEMACIYASLGSEITVIEALPRILPAEDEWVSQLLTREFQRLGIKIVTNTKVTSCEKTGAGIKLTLSDGTTIETQKTLVAVGRKPFCDKKIVDTLSLEMNGPAIKVNEKMQTNIPAIYAIGDVAGKTYLAHGAFLEAEIAAQNIMGGNGCIRDYSLVPKAVYTFPEVASVGLNEISCRQLNIDYSVGRASFRSNGRAVAYNETIGQIRVLLNKKTNKVIGATIVGSMATEMIASARVLLDTSGLISEVSFPHPTVSEALKEAWEDAYGNALHSSIKR